jgi:hypothetical protein
MSLPSAVRLAVFSCIMLIAAKQASACMCGRFGRGKNSWEIAKSGAATASAIFEGTPERFELRWGVLEAKPEDLISADSPNEGHDVSPRMLVTFRVQRAYKGDLRPTVQIGTGLGGGDCGAQFAPGLTYLVYASGPSAHELGVSMCSPAGWIGSSDEAINLRFLRNERPTSADLAPLKSWSSTEQEKQRQHDMEEFEKRYAAVTGSVCGAVVENRTEDESGGSISFLSAQGYSPVAHLRTRINQDGSFCSGRLGPGKYYLYFTRGSKDGVCSASYYPGTPDRAKATAIEINAGQDKTNVVFKIPAQKTYSVRGFITADDKSGLNAVSIALISLDGGYETSYRQTIDFQGFSLLPKTRFFNFDNVVPSRYVAYASVDSQGWLTKKVEVTVSSHMKFLSLELVHKK